MTNVVSFKAKFDGTVIVPVGNIDLPVGELVDMQFTIPQHIMEGRMDAAGGNELPHDSSLAAADANADSSADIDQPGRFDFLLKLVEQFAVDPDAPTDLSINHDRYLNGTPKQ